MSNRDEERAQVVPAYQGVPDAETAKERERAAPADREQPNSEQKRGVGPGDRGQWGNMAGDMNPGDHVPPGTEDASENLCPDCGGSGQRDGAACSTCGGTGRVLEALGGSG